MEADNQKPDKQLTGLCGEHYVAALLAGHGLVVALPRGGAARSDLFVANTKRGRALRVQVKAGRQSYVKYKRKYDGQGCYSWDTDRAIINSHDEGLWYAFVSLGDWPITATERVAFFVRSDDVAARMESYVSNNRSFFWAFEAYLKPYRGADGVTLLKKALAQPCQSPAPPASQTSRLD